VSWKLVKLGTLVELLTKGTTPTSIGYKFTEVGINFVKIESIDLNGNFINNKFAKINEACNEALKRSQLKEGDILFSIAGALGRAAIVSKEILPANTNQAIAIIRLKNSNLISKEFLLRVLASESILSQVGNMKAGVAQQNLSLSQLKEFLIPVPPLQIQQKIVVKLDKIFAEIDKATAMVETNAKNAEVLFKSYLSEVFKRGGEDWKLTTLGEYYDVRDGTHDSPKFQDSGYPLVTSKNLKDGNITFKKIKYISKKDYLNISQRSVVTKGDVLMAMIGTIGNPVVVDTDDEFAIKNVALFKTNNSQSSKFLSYYLSSDYVIKKMEKDCKGTTQKFVGLGYLRSFPIKIPNKNTQEKVVQTLSEYEKYIKIVSKSYVQKLNEILYLKNSILKQAFNGELVKAA
jgi:type I restriction enzyme S subunit